MKKIILSLSLLACIQVAASAQAPAGFNYQGIARNAAGAPLAARSLGMRISIHDGIAGGTVVYQETQTAATNTYGLYNVTIGSGTPVTGTLGGVNWASGNKYIQVELDVDGGTAYSDLGTSQLMSVPYAMSAASGPAPTLSLSNDTISAGGNKIKLPAAPVYSGGTGITVTGTSIGANTTMALWNANQLQGKNISATAPATGQGLVWNGTAWTPTTPATPTSYTAGTGISVSGTGVISANNLAGDVTGVPGTNTVAKIQGTAVAAAAPASGQVLKYNGTAYAPAADNDVQTLSISGTMLSVSGGNSVTLPGFTGTATTNYMSKFTGATTLGNSKFFDNGTKVGIGTSSPLIGIDIIGDTLGLRNPNAPWDNIWFHADGAFASVNASGADQGLMFRVGGTSALTYAASGPGLDTVMTLLPNGNMGVGTMHPASTMEIAGSFAAPIVTVNSNYTVTANDYTILCRAVLNPFTVTLPSAANIAGRIYVVRRAPILPTNTSAIVTVTSTSGINGSNGPSTSIVIYGNSAITAQSDGTTWYVTSPF